jgi:hypothetical protein
MTVDSSDLNDLENAINTKKVGEIVIGALQEILPHIRGASTAEVMMAYTIMIKSTLIGMELSESEKALAKAMLDQMWTQIFVDQAVSFSPIGTTIH